MQWCATLAAASLFVCASLAGAAPKGATLRVTTKADKLARHGGQCSLREAIAAVNSPGGKNACGTASRAANTITLHAGHYRLTIAPSGHDDNTSGDLNVTGSAPVTIVGAGTTSTTIDASGLGDRALSVLHGAHVTLKRLTISGGHPAAAAHGTRGTDNASCTAGGAGGNGAAGANGGGIDNAGSLNLDNVTVDHSSAGAGGGGGSGGAQSATNACAGGSGGRGGNGGGIYNRGSLNLTDSTILANAAGTGGGGGAGGASTDGTGGRGGGGAPGGGGGGIFNRGKLSVTASIFSHNSAGSGGGGAPAGTGGSANGVDGNGGSGGSGGGVFGTDGQLQVTNTTLAANFAAGGGAGSGLTGDGGAGGNGGALEVSSGPSTVRNATVADNGIGAGGTGGSANGSRGASGAGGGLFVQSTKSADDMRLENTVVASNTGLNCAGSGPSSITNGGHDLSYGDRSCPGASGKPKLGRLSRNGGPTLTMALRRGSAAIDRIPAKHGHCPATDQRGVRRPQGKGCDIGAFEFAVPRIMLTAPRNHGSYQRGKRVVARFRCTEGGIASPISMCRGTASRNHPIDTRTGGRKSFKVVAKDKAGNKTIKIVHYFVWAYANPLRAVSGRVAGRIDMGIDYAGSGPLLALGNGKVTYASNNDSGPLSCWGRTCWPGGGVVVYRLSNGPFDGKYVYVAENITVSVRAGQKIRAGQRIATLHPGLPDMETGWASGHGPETLSIARGHQCTCGDPGGWSTIEGRNFDQLLIFVGAPSGYLQPNPPNQRMPHGWPKVPSKSGSASIPRSARYLSEGWTAGPP